MTKLDDKLHYLKSYIKQFDSLLVAFSGGIDSTLLLKVAYEVLGERCMGVTADSPSLPRSELAEAKGLADSIGVRHQILKTGEMQDKNYLRNPANRCYFCKSELYAKLGTVARHKGFEAIANGTNLDDLGDYRPGLQAAEEFRIVSPLKEAKLTKIEIRALAKKMGIETWEKPASPCLSSRIPYGSPVTSQKLAMIEMAEDYLKSLNINNLRVRHFGTTARIEVTDDALPVVKMNFPEISLRFKTIGFVEIELAEFKSGSLNYLINQNAQAAA